jgi:hypothetical protein
MAGKIYRVLSRTTFDFSTMNGNGAIRFTVAKGVDLSEYSEATLITRCHHFDYSNNSAVQVQVFAESPTMEDPAKEFIKGYLPTDPLNATPLVSRSVPYTPVGGFLGVDLIPIPFGGLVRVTVMGSNAVVSNPFTVTLSADIVAKS